MGGPTMSCERCGAGPAGADLFERCALCGAALCDLCLTAGCCGMTPALSARSNGDGAGAAGHADDGRGEGPCRGTRWGSPDDPAGI